MSGPIEVGDVLLVPPSTFGRFGRDRDGGRVARLAVVASPDTDDRRVLIVPGTSWGSPSNRSQGVWAEPEDGTGVKMETYFLPAKAEWVQRRWLLRRARRIGGLPPSGLRALKCLLG